MTGLVHLRLALSLVHNFTKWVIAVSVMVRPLTPHVLPKPRLYPRRLNPFPKPFGSASDPPGSSAYVLFSFTNLRMFLILFLYLILSIPLFTFRSLTLDPDVGYVSLVSDSVPD